MREIHAPTGLLPLAFSIWHMAYGIWHSSPLPCVARDRPLLVSHCKMSKNKGAYAPQQYNTTTFRWELKWLCSKKLQIFFAPARLSRQAKEMEPRMARISRMEIPSFLTCPSEAPAKEGPCPPRNPWLNKNPPARPCVPRSMRPCAVPT